MTTFPAGIASFPTGKKNDFSRWKSHNSSGKISQSVQNQQFAILTVQSWWELVAWEWADWRHYVCAHFCGWFG
jgi:hypothetical protein